MNYLVPAWHTRLGNWAYGTPKLNFDDTVSVAGLLESGQINYSLIITDYLPQLSTRLANIALSPKNVFSVFDYIQGISQTTNRILDYQDFTWPTDCLFEFTPFELIVRRGQKRYATVIFDMEGKINWIDYYNDDELHTTTLLMDSRGFISRIEYYDDQNQQTKISFLNQSGEWRINYYPQTDAVEVNSQFADEFDQLHYDHLNDLVQEVVEHRFFQGLTAKDRLIVTVDNDSRIPQIRYTDFPTVFSASKWHPFDQALAKLARVPNLKLVTDSQFTAQKAQQVLQSPELPHSIPLYQALFRLGHSQRISSQRIYLFIDPLSDDQLEALGNVIFTQLMRYPDRDELYLLSYGGGRGRAERLQKAIMQRHASHILLKGHEPKSKAENVGIDGDFRKEEKKLPVITIKYAEYSDASVLMKNLDKARLLIDWGEHPDDLLQMAAVSIGIPVLQRVQTSEVRDQQNGRICHDLVDLKHGLAHYLDNINNWNVALANDVQIMNQYSADKLLQMWQECLKFGMKGHGRS